MELRAYAKIIWRYIWLVVVIVGIVAAYSGYQYYKLRKTPGALTAYNSNISIQLGLVAPSNGNINPADKVTVSEAVADTLVSGQVYEYKSFCSDISHQIGQDMSQIQQMYPNADLGNWQDAGAIAGALSATRTHSVVTFSVNWNTAAGAWAIANAIGEITSARMGQYLDYPEISAHIVSAVSTPASIPGSSASKPTLLALLVLIALAIAIALAFLLDYLDDRIRSKEDIKDLFHLPIYGEVPRAPMPGHSARARGKSAV